MKTKLILFSVLFSAFSLLSSCTVMSDAIKPSENFITRNYKVKEFTKIDAATVGDIFYTQSTDGTTAVQIYGPDNFVKLILVTVKNQTLTLTMEQHNKIKGNKLKITISSPNLSSILFKGVGDVIIADHFTTSDFKIDSKGVGDIKIDQLTCDKLSIDSKGVGDVIVKGKAQSADLSSKGVGDIQAEELAAACVEASCKGVGDISCYATKSLKASAQGVGSIRYQGNPAKKEFNKSGVGSIKGF